MIFIPEWLIVWCIIHKSQAALHPLNAGLTATQSAISPTSGSICKAGKIDRPRRERPPRGEAAPVSRKTSAQRFVVPLWDALPVSEAVPEWDVLPEASVLPAWFP